MSARRGAQGLFFVEHGTKPRPTSVLYDRERSAFAIAAADLVLEADALAGARFAAVSGVTPALGAGARALVERFADLAATAGVGFCIDVNYRRRLWSESDATAALTPLLRRAEVVVLLGVGRRAPFSP